MSSSTQRRVTMHNARRSKVDGHVFTPKHNDRDFEQDKAAHIDQSRQDLNAYWNCYGGGTFEECEKRYYEEHFGPALEAKNQAAIAARHPERVISMDEYRRAGRTCPEEQIIMLGDKHQQHDRDLYLRVLHDQLAWERAKYPQAVILNAALHMDEQGGPHFHIRRVWVGHDQEGREVVGQSKALAEMGVQPPDQAKDYGRHNNSKMSYTTDCRHHLQELCQGYGLQIETTPKERGKQGRSQAEYITEQQEARLDEAQRDLTLTEYERDKAADERDRLTAQNAQQAARNEELRQQGADLAAEIGRQEVLASTARGNAQQAKKIEQRAREATSATMAEMEETKKKAAQQEELLSQRGPLADRPRHGMGRKYVKVFEDEIPAMDRLLQANPHVLEAQEEANRITRAAERRVLEIRQQGQKELNAIQSRIGRLEEKANSLTEGMASSQLHRYKQREEILKASYPGVWRELFGGGKPPKQKNRGWDDPGGRD